MPMFRFLVSEPPFRLFFRALLKSGLGPWEAAVWFDALSYTHYAVGLQTAARYASHFGYKSFCAIEFGVAGGNGLVALCDHARQAGKLYGLNIRVVGFDCGDGLPPIQDWRDAPWFYNPGDYPGAVDKLRKRIADRAELVIGDLRESFPTWLNQTRDPIGFISVDVDYYCSTKAILDALSKAGCEKMLPVCSVYLDDILCFGVPRCTGELAAVEDFNRGTLFRRFDRADWISERRPYKDSLWLKRMYDFYCFDHPKMQNHLKREAVRKDLAY
jgi:hypothetical protein